jgi:thiopurine S-methyltransferase
MEPDFWHERWQSNQIAFHKERVNPFLERNLAALELGGGACVFVPLCGKSLDMLWLTQQGLRVLGVEISPIAVRAFFEENGLAYRERRQGALTLLEGGSVRLLCGDFFDLPRTEVLDVAAVYDRASLIALPPERRRAYVDHLMHLLPERPRVLLITLEYPPEQMNGPPFSVSEAEVRGLFADAYHIRLLGAQDVLSAEPRFRERGLSWLEERAYLLTAHRSAEPGAGNHVQP